MGEVDPLYQNISACMIVHRKKKWWYLVFRLAMLCQSIMLIRYITIKKHLLRKIYWSAKLLSVRRIIVNTYYHRDNIAAKSSNSFPAPRKSVKVSSEVTGLERVINECVVAAKNDKILLWFFSSWTCHHSCVLL